MKKLKCKVCECEFIPEKKEHYISRDEVKTGLSNLVGRMEEEIYDTFDCPQCGCQNVVGVRKRELYMGKNIKEETEKSDDNETTIKEDVELDFIHPHKTAGKLISVDVIDKISNEIDRSKTKYEMQAANVNVNDKMLIDDIYHDITNIIDKYNKKARGEE